MDVTIDKNESYDVLDIPQSQTNGDASIEFEFSRPPSSQPPRFQPQRPPPPPPPPPPPAPATMPRGDFNKTMEDFANPRKLKPMDTIGQRHDDDDDADLDADFSSEDDGGSGIGEDGHQADEQYSVDEPAYEEYAREEVLRPSPGYTTIDEEKANLVFKIHRAKRSGMPVTRTFTMQSDIKDMRAEMTRIEHELALDASLKFQRKMLMMSVSTLEFLNNRYDPFDLQLNNWSESVMDSIHDYDRVFERLHEKYKSKVSVAPEIELLMMVAGSAMMFHFTNSMFKKSLPGLSGGGGSPELMSTMMKAMMQASGNGAAPPAPTPAAPPPPPPPPPSSQVQQQQQQQPGFRREMRGPPMDIGGLVGSLGGGAMPFPPMPPPVPADKPKKSVSFAPGTKRPSPAEMDLAPLTKKARDDADEIDSLSSLGDDDRLSDVISEDLESLPEIEPDDTVKISTVTAARGRGRGRGRGGASSVKNVITL